MTKNETCTQCGVRPRMESYPLYTICTECWREANNVPKGTIGKAHAVPMNHPSRHRGTKRTGKGE